MIIFSISSNPGTFGTYLYNSLFSQLRLNYIYKTLKIVHNDDLERLFYLFKRLDEIHGMSISMPFKKDAALAFDKRGICPGLEVLSDVPSVNTICKFKNDILSFSTDLAFISKFAERIDITKPVYIYGDGSLGQLSNAYLNRQGFHCKLIRRNDLDHIKNHMDFEDKSAFLNCTPSSLENLGVANFENMYILDAPVRYVHPFRGMTNLMTGLDCAFIQFQYQFKIYTGLDVSLSHIMEIFNERSK